MRSPRTVVLRSLDNGARMTRRATSAALTLLLLLTSSAMVNVGSLGFALTESRAEAAEVRAASSHRSGQRPTDFEHDEQPRSAAIQAAGQPPRIGEVGVEILPPGCPTAVDAPRPLPSPGRIVPSDLDPPPRVS